MDAFRQPLVFVGLLPVVMQSQPADVTASPATASAPAYEFVEVTVKVSGATVGTIFLPMPH